MKKYLSSAVFVAIFLAFGFYLNKNLGLILSTFNTTVSNMTRYFFVAVALILVSFYFLSKSYQVVFRMNGLMRKTWDLFKLRIIAVVVNVIIPMVGLSQMFVYLEDAKKKNLSQTKTVNSVIVTIISDYTSIALFLIFSIIYLYAVDRVVPYVVIPAAVFILITLGVYALAYFAGKESKGLEKLIIFLGKKSEKLIYFFTRKHVELGSKASGLYKEFKDVNKAILEDPKDWFMAIGLACLYHLFSVFALFFIFISLGVHPLIRVVVAGYSVGATFIVVSPTPNGIGFVEGGMYLVFTSLGIPAPIATTAVIIYRGLTFWIPLFIGFIAYQRGKIRDIIGKNKKF